MFEGDEKKRSCDESAADPRWSGAPLIVPSISSLAPLSARSRSADPTSDPSASVPDGPKVSLGPSLIASPLQLNWPGRPRRFGTFRDHDRPSPRPLNAAIDKGLRGGTGEAGGDP